MRKLTILVDTDPWSPPSIAVQPAELLTINEAGPALWEELHLKEDATEDWFRNDWLPRVPRYCACTEKLASLLTRIPPRYGDEWFFFTWELHNAVRASLKQSLFSLDEAEARWGRRAPRWECDQCGACCRASRVVDCITKEDLAREPRVLQIIQHPKQCPLLDGNACSIQSTKPTCCRVFEPGSSLCRSSRQREGITLPLEFVSSLSDED